MNAARSASGTGLCGFDLEERVLVGAELRDRLLVREDTMLVVMVLAVVVVAMVVVVVPVLPVAAVVPGLRVPVVVLFGHVASVAPSCASGTSLSTLVASRPHQRG